MRKFMMALLLVSGSLFLAACGAGRVSLVRERGSDVFNVTVELNEDDIAQLVEDALLAGTNPLLRDPVVDLQNGQIKVTGTHERRDGSGEVSGSMIIVPSVQDGHLVVEATEINIEGVAVSDARVDQFNNNLAQRLARHTEQRNRDITMTSVTVTDDLLTLMFDATPRN